MPEIINLLKKASISMLLESYDDIFSDFDPRAYTERALSDDFLIEARKAVRETKMGVFELHLLIPKNLHKPHEEGTIKDRMHQHFRQTEHYLLQEQKGVLKKGIVLTSIGVLLMLIGSILSISAQQEYLLHLLRVIVEPGGWFMVWYGLDQIFYVSKEQKSDLNFYRKMMKAEIHFDPY
jgi:hypothetical protein